MSAALGDVATARPQRDDYPELVAMQATNRVNAGRAGVFSVIEAILDTPPGPHREGLVDLLIAQAVEFRSAVLFQQNLPLS